MCVCVCVCVCYMCFLWLSCDFIVYLHGTYIFCECLANSLNNISSSLNIREDIDFEQPKVGLLHRPSKMKAE